MYRDFSENSIFLKVWTGKSWEWLHCRLSGSRFSGNDQPLSPSVVLRKDYNYLDVPVKMPIMDKRNAVQRMKDREKICSVQFTNRDAFAVCCILNADGDRESALFIKGGRQYTHSCAQILTKIESSRASRGKGSGEMPDKKHWKKLKQLNSHYSHMVSSRIIEYSVKNEAKLLVLPRFEPEYSKMVMKASGNWSPLHLSSQIREKLGYKAWKSGLLILEPDVRDAGAKCAECQAPIMKKGAGFVCKNGHTGDKDLNFATNLGRKCQLSFKNK